MERKAMQINLNSPLWKEALKYLGWVLLFLVLWFKGCSGEKSDTIIKVITPDVIGKFEPKKPIHEPIISKTIKVKTVFTQNPINKELVAENKQLKADFVKANDSIKQLSFNKAIQLNKFSTKFEDENVVLNIDGVVQGEVKEVTPSYTIKERKVEVQVKPKETVFRLLGGMELGNNRQLDGFAAKGNLMLQNRKGNILSGSFDTNQNVWIGYNFSIFDIKR